MQKTTIAAYQRRDAPLVRADEIVLDNGVRIRYIDLLIQNARQVLKKRYGRYFRDSRWIQQMFHLLETQHDLAIKIFVVQFIIANEPFIASAISEMYVLFLFRDTVSRKVTVSL